MSKFARNTVMAVAVAASTLAMNAGAFAQQDPTQGRIQSRELARKAEARKKYNRCAETSLHFFRACSGQAGNDSSRIRNCRNVYHDKLARCRVLYL